MIYLTSEIATAEEHVNTADIGESIREVLSLADRGLWDFKIKLPNGRKYSVHQLVRRWHLSRYVNNQKEEAI